MLAFLFIFFYFQAALLIPPKKLWDKTSSTKSEDFYDPKEQPLNGIFVVGAPHTRLRGLSDQASPSKNVANRLNSTGIAHRLLLSK
jgi:hypothetical protein